MKIKKDDKVIGILLILFVVISIASYLGYFESREKRFQEDLIKTKDNNFVKWISTSYTNIESHISDVANASKINDYEGYATHGRFLKKDVEIYLNQSKQLEVSPGLIPANDEFQNVLENYYLTGKYLEEGGINSDDKSIVTAAEYTRKAMSDMIKVSEIIEKYMKIRS